MAHLFATAFALGVTVCIMPGPVSAEALQRGLARGFRAAFLFELGTLAGDAVWGLLALSGAAALMAHGVAARALHFLGAGVLMWLATNAFRRAWAGGVAQSPLPTTRGDLATGATLSLLNSGNLAFWLGVGGAIVSTADIPNAGRTGFAVFFAGYMLACLLWCLVYPAGIAFGRGFANPGLVRWINVGCGLVLFGFGVSVLRGAVGAVSP